jgi:tetratricopeptide (TPR) repeat protein
VEAEELQQTNLFLQEAVAVVPKFQILNESFQICRAHLRVSRNPLTSNHLEMKLPSPEGLCQTGSVANGAIQSEGIHNLLAEGDKLLKNGGASAALSLLENAGLSDSKLAGVNLLRFQCLARLGRNREALQAALIELSLVPDNQAVLTAVLGQLQITEQEIQTSPVEILKGMDELSRYSRQCQLQVRGIERARALCLLKLSRTREAMAALERERVLNPQDTSVQTLLERLQQSEAFENELVRL